MHPTNKKVPGANATPQPFNRRAGHAPQVNPAAAQLKTAVSAQGVRRPVAPPVYRPQQVPKVLQTKSSPARNPQAGQVPRQPVAPTVNRPQAKPASVQVKTAGSPQIKSHPTAPPAYRPQPVAKVLQTKGAVTQGPREPAQRRSVGIVQRTLARVTGAGPMPATNMPGAVVQCDPMVTVKGVKVDAANWGLREIVDWLHDPQRDVTERQAMLEHLKSKSTARLDTAANSWAQENPYYLYSTAEKGGAVESYYFASSTNPGKIGRLRSQHAHGPTATAFQYTTQMCGDGKAAAKLHKYYEQNKGISLSDLVEYGKSLGMADGLLPGMAHVEIFTRNDPSILSNRSQPVTSVHRSGGVVTFSEHLMSNSTAENQQFVTTWFQVNRSNVERLEQEDVFDSLYSRPKYTIAKRKI